VIFNTEKSIAFKTIKILESQGIPKIDFYKWKLYHTEAYSKFISQAEINFDIAIVRYKDSIKNQNRVYH